MTDGWIWGLMASLVVLAIGTTLKSAYDAFLLKQSDKEVTRLNSEIETLNKLHNKAISDIEQSHSTEVAKLSDRINKLEHRITLKNLKPISYPSKGQSWMT